MILRLLVFKVKLMLPSVIDESIGQGILFEILRESLVIYSPKFGAIHKLKS